MKDRDAFIRCNKCFSIPLMYLNLSEENPKVIPYCRCKEKKWKKSRIKRFFRKKYYPSKINSFFM